MSEGFIDWTELGFFPQDHEEKVPLGIRMTAAMARVLKRPNAGDDGGQPTIAAERGMGTLGDLHPFFFWQTKEREKRAMGSWSMAWAVMAVDGGDGGGRYAAEPSRFQPLQIGDDKGFKNDVRYGQAEPQWPSCLPVNPMGTLGLLMPTTDEEFQGAAFVRADPRLIVPNVEGPGEAGTLVVDCQPNGELCMSGNDAKGIPGKGGRSARLQSVFRVIALNTNSASSLGASGLNAVAINHAKSQQDKIIGYGAVWAEMETGGGGGPIRPGRGPVGGKRPGGKGPPGPIRPGPSNRPRPIGGGNNGPKGATQGPGPSPGFSGPKGGPELDGGGASDEGLTPCDFGEFTPAPLKGHGIALMAHNGACGPLHPGGSSDQHSFGKDADGNPINAGHIAVDAYFYKDDGKDGPLFFEEEWPEDVASYPLKAFVHLEWDKSLNHKWCRGGGRGKWRWWAEVPYVAPTGGPVTPVTTTPVTTPGPIRPPGPGTPGPTRPGPTPGPGPGPGPIRPPGGGPGPIRPPGSPGPIRPGPGPGQSWGIGTRPGPGGPPSGGGPIRPGPNAPGRPSGINPPGGGRPPGGGGPITPGPRAPGEPAAPGPRPPENNGGGDFNGGVFVGQTQIIPFLGPSEGSRGPGAGGTDYFRNKFDVGVMSSFAREGIPDVHFGAMERIGQTVPEDVALYQIFHPLNEGFAAISFRPQLALRGVPNFEHNPSIPGQVIILDEITRPTVLTVRAWGKQSKSGDWGYHANPHQSRARGGSVDGGIFYAPPHLELEDYFDIGSTAPVGLADIETTSFVTVAPGVSFAAGTPNLDGGLNDGSFVIRQDPADVVDGSFFLGQFRNGSLVSLIEGRVSQSSGEVVVDVGKGGTQAISIARGTVAQRPSVLGPLAGQIRIVTDLVVGTDVLEVYDFQNALWTLVSGILPADLDDAFFKDGSKNMTGALVGVSGTALLPGYTFVSDLNTGMWRPAADTIAWSTNGSEAMRIDSTGRVGIGGTPGQKLDVSDTSSGAVSIRVENLSNASVGADARMVIRVAGTSGGDPHTRWLIQGGQSYCAGLANAAGDEWKLCSAANLDSGTAIAVTPASAVYMPVSLAVGQNVVADAAAAIEIESTTKGFLNARMTTTQRDLISAVAGLQIYNTTTSKLNFYNGSAWEAVTSA